MNKTKFMKWFDLRKFGFSDFERRALWFLIILIIIGATIRYVRHRHWADRIDLWVETADRHQSSIETPTYQKPTVENPLNLNYAVKTELEMLFGIGPKKADQIIQFRQDCGNFESVDDLMKVSGIGPKTVERLREIVTVIAPDDPIQSDHSTQNDSLPTGLLEPVP
ncbi:MAG: helix-hairpin-helix domain-containing protein [Candidatus Electryoneaceae bacterium]|nr:helix-hairpin-helix domain-containing protein [Candidatus Electryoneaceae bacterium]